MKERLFTPSYILILGANFLMYSGFWMLVPVLPFFLYERFDCTESVIGLILCCYTISSLCVRPFSAYLLDTFRRKPLYILAYFVFCSCFLGYILSATLTAFIVLRVAHGLAFGTVTVGGNTIVVDIMPSSRRGEGLGYYGLTNNTAMSIGPMVGLMLKDSMTFESLFTVGLACTVLGFVLAALVKCPHKPQVRRQPLSFDRFILIKGIPATVALLLLSVPYGATTNYVAVYAQDIGLDVPTGLFFTCMAVGMGVSRIFSGKWVDRGYICKIISGGFYLVTAAFLLLSCCVYIVAWNATVCAFAFFLVALMLGIGFGVMFPAYNTLYINLAPNNRRATATSTYLTAWDIGIGIGIFSGGLIAETLSFDKIYLVGTCFCILSMLYFNLYVARHYERNKLR
ncbi:MAG: MFS transporter [Bacteroides sp.]|nr:MFS transporter [Roseburia sp.]MCM1346797.1 MFS transporter [Bacteroides sp.]MCM1420272.1 MFS transporter [Bacteroides sp.]